MKQFDVKDAVKDIMEYNKESELHGFGGNVSHEVEKVTIKHKLIQRPHHFKNGKGRVAKKLTIVIEFNDAVIQPHSEFESSYVHCLIEQLANEVNGLWENQD